jgi:hypothetical protein
MRTVFIALITIIFCAPVWAGNTTLTWELPTGSEQCTNDTTVPVIASTEVWQLVASLPGDATEHTITGLPPGEYQYVASVTDEQGQTSRFSGVAAKTIDSMTVVDNKAYTLVQSQGNFVAIIIGTVPVGTVCNADSMVKGQFNFAPFTGYSVPVESVTITGDTEPVMVVAQCE